MSFRDLQLEDIYDSINNDLLDEFYVPVLATARRYDRMTGYFSSSALASAARGLYHFLRNDGRMRMIVGSTLRQQDLDAILSGEKSREEVLAANFSKELEEFHNLATEDHVRALGWLVSKGLLDIRIAHLLNEIGDIVPFNRLDGIFHVKVGILTDMTGHQISFSGSINETSMGWERNYEEFKVFRDWIEGDANKVVSDRNRFERLWCGQSKRMMVEPVPEAFEKRLISLAPKSLSELSTLRSKGSIKLRDYQKTALQQWFGNGRKGILAMATGTGKTITAIEILKKVAAKEKPLLAVVAVPFIHLISQWKDVLELYGLHAEVAQGSTSEWANRIADKIYDLSASIDDILIVLVTHASFCRESFLSLMEIADIPWMLIADEVHGLGSPEHAKGLVPRYDFRLGLSATPERYFDEEGTKAIIDFFDGIVYRFPLRMAIERGYLSRYDYHPSFVGLSDSEMEEYQELTKKIARAYHAAKDSEEARSIYEQYCFLRSRVVRNAEMKYAELDRILSKIEKKQYILIYCSPQQIDRVQEKLAGMRPKIVQSRFTAEESRREREDLLDSFARGTHQVLVAMRCLDEGVDVPATKYAIFMSSTTNPRQFVQRRGRVLRVSKGKGKSEIYDIVVVPSLTGSIADEYVELERKIVEKELDRCLEFMSAADNQGEYKQDVKKLADSHDIDLEAREE